MTRYCTMIDRAILKLEYRVAQLGYHNCKILAVTAHDDVVPIYNTGLVLGAEVNFIHDAAVPESEAYVLVTKILKKNPNFTQAKSLRILHGVWADENLNLTDPFIWEDNVWLEYRNSTLINDLSEPGVMKLDFGVHSRFCVDDDNLVTKLANIEWEML